MILKRYHSYIIKVYLSNLIVVSIVFLSLSFFLNIFEEIKFFEYIKVSIFVPIILTLLNIPTVFFELLPFVFLLSAKFFFIYLYDKNELNILKNNGINNFKIITIISLTTFVTGLIIILFYYTASSNLKNTYLNLKNKYSSKNEYLAVVNENGLWLKEEIGNFVNIINAKTFKDDKLQSITVTRLDKNYNTKDTIISEKADILSNQWSMKNVTIYNPLEIDKKYDEYKYYSSFDSELISSLFSNLNSLNILQLHDQIKNYNSLGYSATDVKIHLHKIYSLPLYIVLMTVIGCLVMLKFHFIRTKFFILIIGVFLSVIVYYINYFSKLFGSNETLPVELSIWLPQLILVLVCFLGLIKINEQ
tara:strand:+ start:145 stop:1227 length:1083 start_codon:yes stop_codon:yes gene_type:complete